MARLVPYEIDAARARGSASNELATLDLLESVLGDEFTIYHGVHWARVEGGASIYGEIDFIIVDRMGRLLAIEQKNGLIESDGSDLFKNYASGPKSIRAQVNRNIQNLTSEFSKRHDDRRLDIDHLLFCPDDNVLGRLPASIDRQRVVDATQARHLPDRIQNLFDRRSNSTQAHAANSLEVHAFLSELVEVSPDIDSMREFAHKESKRLSGGLTTWARRLEITPFRLRVTGTAGSGKTQLALMELQAAHARGLSAMYVCFNRPLAEAMRQAAPEPAAITTFHEFGAWAMRAAGAVIDFSDPEIFNKQARAVIDAAKEMSQSLDLLVIDEGQDFEAEWAQALEHLVKPNGRAIWLEDPEQRLYQRAPAALSGWVRLHSPVNYRSPRVITTLIEQLGLNDYPMEAGSSFQGFDPSMRSYSEEAGQIRETSAAVSDLLEQGYLPADIVVLSWQGLDRTVITRAEEIAGKSTRRFTGRYNDSGEAIYTEGELRVETVHRFKGQAADCIVLTGVDFDEWTSDAKRRLFVAMTRARIRLAIVASGRVEQLVVETLSGMG